MAKTSDPLVSISAAAKAIGVSRQTLWAQVRDGAVRSHGGKVRVSEAIADRQANVATDFRRRSGKRKAVKEPVRPALDVEDLEAGEWLVMDTLVQSDAPTVTLDWIEWIDTTITLSRVDARALVLAYRAAYVAMNRGGDGKAELRSLYTLRKRLGIPVDA
jgi:hypothetical protein